VSGLASLTGHRAETSPAASDPRLRGRTYAIAFEEVWTAAVALASRGLPRVTLRGADDRSGRIEAEGTSRILGRIDDISIRVGLDENAQTRVDMHSVAREPKTDLGRNRRRVAAFFRGLDAALDAAPHQILDAGPER
jgi:hypothetical protein